MPRTLDEILRGQGVFGPTPLPPTAMLSTPPPPMMPYGGMPSMPMGMMQQDLVARAMPQPLPTPQMPQFGTQQMAMIAPTPMPTAMPTPPLRATPGVTGAFTPPGMADVANQLAMTAGYLDPTKATEYARQIWGQRVERRAEQIGNYAGLALSAVPAGGWAAGLAASFLAGPLANNPVTRALFGPSERAAQHLSMMANLQHRTFGQLQLIGADVGLGGAGMGTMAAMQLGQQFTARAEEWGRGHGRGWRDPDVQKYKQDLIRMTEMAAQAGLLDAATNIDQISDTVMKLMKVMGRMAKLTGDPDFRNNLQQIAQLRTMGLSIDQAVETTRSLAFYSRGLGMSAQALFQQGGMQGLQAWAQVGLAPGLGVAHGAAAQARARQFAGVFDPYTEQILGGREGIQQRLTTMGAQFAAGPAMQAMLGAAMTFNAKGELFADPARVQEMMRGGMSMSQLAAASMQNFDRIAQEAAERLRISPAEARNQIYIRRRALLSQLAEDPERLHMLQLGMYGALRRGGLESTAAAFAVGGGEEEAQIIQRMAADPTIRQRMQVQLNEQLRTLRKEARKERTELREQYEELQSSRSVWGRMKAFLWEPGATEFGRLLQRQVEVGRAREAEELVREQAERQDEETGVSAVYMGRTNPRILEEFRRAEQQRIEAGRFVSPERGGLREFAHLRSLGIQRGNLYLSPKLRHIARELAREPDRPRGRPYYTDEDQERILADAVALGNSIETAQEKTLRDLSRSVDLIANQVKQAGGDPTKVRPELYAMGSAAITEIEASGGKGISRRKLHEIVTKGLIAMGLSPEEARHSVEKHAKEWETYLINDVMQFGSDKAKMAVSLHLEKTDRITAELGKITKEELQKRIDEAEKDWSRQREKAGVTAGRGLTTEEKRAEDVLRTAIGRSNEEGAALLLAAQAQYGGTPEEREQARLELRKMVEEGKGDLFAGAREQLADLGPEGRKLLGRYGRLAAPEERTLAGYTRQFAARRHRNYSSKQIAGGAFGGMFGSEVWASVAEAMGGRIEGGKVVFGESSTAGTMVAGEAEKLKEESRALDQLAREFPDATKELKIAAVALQEAARNFSSKIEIATVEGKHRLSE